LVLERLKFIDYLTDCLLVNVLLVNVLLVDVMRVEVHMTVDDLYVNKIIYS
jgi:hypothetical protein